MIIFEISGNSGFDQLGLIINEFDWKCAAGTKIDIKKQGFSRMLNSLIVKS